MDLYASTSYSISRLLTNTYSTSFGMSSRLFARSIQPHIYAIYGMVRLADEIVDTYRGDDMAAVLDAFEVQVADACATGYSTNPVVHAFALTARLYDIDQSLIAPFFKSMRVDILRKGYDEKGYREYIYGSAEVIGLLCLKVFCGGDPTQYAALKQGAQSLGAAYQKVNFLRDMASDYTELGRLYFPGTIRYETFSEEDKAAIIADIKKDFEQARLSVQKLPKNARNAVQLSQRYYAALLTRIERASVEQLKTMRIRIPNAQKVWLMAPFWLKGILHI